MNRKRFLPMLTAFYLLAALFCTPALAVGSVADAVEQTWGCLLYTSNQVVYLTHQTRSLWRVSAAHDPKLQKPVRYWPKLKRGISL